MAKKNNEIAQNPSDETVVGGETVYSDESPVTEQRASQAPQAEITIVQETPDAEKSAKEKLDDPKFRSWARRELTPIEQKLADEKRHLLSLRRRDRHDFILLMKFPNSNLNEKANRSRGQGSYSPSNPCVEALFIYDASTTIGQIQKKVARGDFVMDYNFTDRCLEDAESDERIKAIVMYVNSELVPVEQAAKKINLRSKFADFKKTGKIAPVEVAQSTIDEMYKRATEKRSE